MSNWKQQLHDVWAAEERRKTLKKRAVTPFDVLTLTVGDAVYFVPPRATHERYGQRAQVLRPPRRDVAAPSVRIQFADGTPQTVPARHLRRTPAAPVDPPYLTDARTRPSWPRLVRQLQDAQRHEAGDGDAPRAQTLRQEAEQRARQLAGMTLPKGSDAEIRRSAVTVLLAAAETEARAQAAQVAGRAGRGPVQHAALPEPSTTVDPTRLDQDQRAMINLIAKSIHRRYFLSDRQIEQGLSEQEREQTRIHGVLRQVIGLGQQEAGSTEATNKRGGKGSELQGLVQDNLTAAYQKALEACQWLSSGNVGNARTLAAQVQGHRAVALAADTELERHRVKHHTGRYFHGDILSVRQEHVELDDQGNFESYLGMTQYYARVVFVYGEDGHTLIVANAPELESLTGLRVGPQGWASLCRWVQDLSERAEGRKQGRRQEDDERLIYRDNEGFLRLRENLEKYPHVLLALDCIRCALLLGMEQKGIWGGELLDNSPKAGKHNALSFMSKAEKVPGHY